MQPIQATTFVVKTFLRPHCLDRLISSIRANYPDVPILVADDSPTPVARKDVQVHALPYDCGLSFGRNYLVDRVQTEYFLLMDDDHVFEDRTRIETLLAPIARNRFDLVGAQVVEACGPFAWEGLLELDGTALTLRKGDNGLVDGVARVDFCHNFFAARTEMVRKLRWDDTLKLGEHTDFFLRAAGAGLRVGYDATVKVQHLPEKSGDYAGFRARAKGYRKTMMRKHGLQKITNELHPVGNVDLSAGGSD